MNTNLLSPKVKKFIKVTLFALLFSTAHCITFANSEIKKSLYCKFFYHITGDQPKEIKYLTDQQGD